MPAYYVYMIECHDSKGNRTYYTGSTNDLTKRFQQHSEGKGARYTKGKKLKLVFYETFLTRSDAMRREIEIKAFSLEKKTALIEGINKKAPD